MKLFSFYYKLNLSRKLVLISILILLSIFSIACNNIDVNISENPKSGNNSENSDVSSNRSPESGTLRLWMQEIDNFNPLVSNQLQFHQISNLIYESLVTIDENQKTTMLLANEIIVNSNSRVYKISIKENILFHDNTGLTPDDVVSTANFIMNLENNSKFAYLFNNVETVIVNEEMKIEFLLKMPDPFFIHKLIFPILQKSTLEEKDTYIYPGTGVYEIKNISRGNGIDIEIFSNNRNSSSYNVKRIRVYFLESTRSALGAFSDDKIDMVYLDDINYEIYRYRNDVIISKFPGNTFMFFEINTDKDKILNERDNFVYIKEFLSYAAYNMVDKEIISYSNFPFYTSFIDYDFKIHDENFEENLQNKLFEQSKTPLKFVYDVSDDFSSDIAINIEKNFKEKKIKIDLIGADTDNYDEYIENREYDIIIRKAKLNNNPDPSWLYFADPFNNVSGSDILKYPGDVAEYNATMEKFKRLYNNNHEIVLKPEFTIMLLETLDVSPYIGIGFRINGFMQSNRVVGLLKSNSFNKFYGIEDVWVWSGQ